MGDHLELMRQHAQRFAALHGGRVRPEVEDPEGLLEDLRELEPFRPKPSQSG
ncbi:hypothetical protein SEA_OREGANO_33 [Gordonia phage Oregano]|nr:hypothetical protein SEA_OREGANO_33 [Gordonia phage Oregano]